MSTKKILPAVLAVAVVVIAIFVGVKLLGGGSYEDKLPGEWYADPEASSIDEPLFTLYTDGTCTIWGEYGTGHWALVNDNQLKLTNIYGQELMGATDAGDVSSLMPFIHISTGGYDGDAHSKDFTICDPEMAYVMPARAMVMTVIDLLWDGAAKARAIRESFRPKFTRETYLQFWDRFCAGTVDRSSF